MNRLLLLIPIAACFALQAHAQITITHADLEAALSIEGTNTLYATESSSALTALAAQTGANQTWDFTGLTYDPAYVTVVTKVVPPVPGSDDPHLAQATHIFRIESPDSTAYTFQTLEPSAATFLGLTGPEVLVRYLPEQVFVVLPFTFGTTWTSSYETQFEPGFPPGVTLTTEEANDVVGWGTLVTPAGSTEALMIRTETTTTLDFPGFPPIITTSAQILFSAYGLLNANIYLPSSGPASGDYNVYDGTVATEPLAETARAAQLDAIAPNPLHLGDAVTLTYALPAPATVRLDVLDARGRNVATILDGAPQSAGRHQTTWTTAGLAPGLYVVRLTAGGQTASRRLTLTR